MPGDTPVIMPVLPIVAIGVDPLLHVPPATPLLSRLLVPTHKAADPEIVVGVAKTVIALVAMQPPIEYVMVEVPDVMPQAIPVADPIVATTVVDTDHTPPATLLVSVPQSPTHILNGPSIAAGVAFTVIVFVTVHPVTP